MRVRLAGSIQSIAAVKAELDRYPEVTTEGPIKRRHDAELKFGFVEIGEFIVQIKDWLPLAQSVVAVAKALWPATKATPAAAAPPTAREKSIKIEVTTSDGRVVVNVGPETSEQDVEIQLNVLRKQR